MAWISGAISAGVGLLGSDASSDAADAQVASGRESNALQRETRDLIRADNAPWLARGNAAGARLAQLMGLNVGGYRADGSPAPTRDTLRSQLLSRFTKTAPGAPQNRMEWLAAQQQPGGSQSDTWAGGNPYFNEAGPATSTVDEQGLNAEIDRMMAEQGGQNEPQSSDFGSLFKKFDASSVANDPGYQFALEEGNKATNNAANARNGLYSGSTLKALARFNQGNATKYFGDAFNRDQVTKGQQYNMLSGTANTGQAAVNQVSNANQNYATSAGNNITDMGNARASGYVGGANALNSAIGQGINNYNQQQFMNKLPNYGSRSSPSISSRMYNDVTDIPLQPGGGY